MRTLSFFEKLLARVRPSKVSGRTPARFRAVLGAIEALEDRTTPSLIGGQVLPILPIVPVGTSPNTVSVIAPGLSGTSPTPQTITLTDTIAGAPTGGTVVFTLPGGLGTTAPIPVVNGVATTVFTIPVGTPNTAGGIVTATYSGTVGVPASSSTGSGNGTLAFCVEGDSTLLGTTLQSFAVLAGSTVTNTGATLINGNVGVSPGSAITGLAAQPNPPAPGSVIGTLHSNDAVAIQAQTELTTAYTQIAGAPPAGFTNLTGKDLGGLTLTPGLYHFDSSAQLTGTLTLNDENDPNAIFEFQIGSTLTTASNSVVRFINGGADNVYWEVGSSATLGSSTVFAGNILAQASITLDSTASIACGRALARSGAVTMIDNFIDPAPKPGLTVLIPAHASSGVVTGTTVLLSVKGSDPITGASSLHYTWSTLAAPAGAAAPTFSVNGSNSAQNTTVTFHAAGTYVFTVTIRDPHGLSTTSNVIVTVKQTLTSIRVIPTSPTVQQGETDRLAALAFDQFHARLLVQPVFNWSIAQGIGKVSATGVFTAPSQKRGIAVIRVSSGRVSATTSVTVVS